jgi:hypothetical protein
MRNVHIPTLDVWLINLTAIGMSFSDIETALRILVLVVGLGYSVWKWHSEYKKRR